jgi:PEP-CTERM motif
MLLARFMTRLVARRLLAAAGCLLATSAPAQVAINIVSTATTDQSNQTINGTVFERTTTRITTFYDAAANIYDANTVSGSAFIRRNTTAGNGNNSSVWYDQGTQAGRFSAPYATTYADLLLGNNILRGSDNTFSNDAGVAGGNIERIDFLLNSNGITASLDTAFAIFDRGAVNQHDYVKIAVITGWDSVNNRPTAYGGVLVSVDTADYGTTNPIGGFDYNLFRYDSGDAMGTGNYWDVNTETGNQGIGGVAVSLSDLGLAAGTTIYGYSLMGYDVTTGGNMANLVDWTNTTYYATNTTGETGSGGIDLSAVNGVLYNRRVPEPATYGAMVLGFGVAFLGWRRWRRRVTARAA